MEHELPSADESEESSEATSAATAPCDAGQQPQQVADENTAHEKEALANACLQHELKHVETATCEVHTVAQAGVVLGVVGSDGGVALTTAGARPNWEQSEDEKKAAAQLDWPPALGHAITLACFGCEQRAEGAEEEAAQRRVHASLVHKCDDLKAGDECVCLDARDGQQWLATIKKVTEHHAQVHFKGWSKSTDSWVTRDKLALKPAPHVLERIKQYNQHSKLKQTSASKNHLNAPQHRPTDLDCSDTESSRGLEGREI